MTNRILLTYQHISERSLPQMALHIVLCMTDNKHYPDPTPTLDELRSQIARFQDVFSLLQIGNKQLELEKDKQCELLRSLLHELAAYVTREAREDRAKLLSSGFDISKERARRSSRTIEIKTGRARGEVTSIMYSVSGARAYLHQYSLGAPQKEADWKEELSTSRKHVFKGLIPGKEYYFRIIAIALHNKKTITGVVVKIVQ